MKEATKYLKEAIGKFKQWIINSIRSPDSKKYDTFKTVLTCLRDSETSTQELEIVLSRMELDEEEKKKIVFSYLANLVNMNKP